MRASWCYHPGFSWSQIWIVTLILSTLSHYVHVCVLCCVLCTVNVLSFVFNVCKYEHIYLILYFFCYFGCSHYWTRIAMKENNSSLNTKDTRCGNLINQDTKVDNKSDWTLSYVLHSFLFHYSITFSMFVLRSTYLGSVVYIQFHVCV